MSCWSMSLPRWGHLRSVLHTPLSRLCGPPFALQYSYRCSFSHDTTRHGSFGYETTHRLHRNYARLYESHRGTEHRTRYATAVNISKSCGATARLLSKGCHLCLGAHPQVLFEQRCSLYRFAICKPRSTRLATTPAQAIQSS